MEQREVRQLKEELGEVISEFFRRQELRVGTSGAKDFTVWTSPVSDDQWLEVTTDLKPRPRENS